MKKGILLLALVAFLVQSTSSQITWMGNEYTTLSTTQYLGDPILFEIQSYPQGSNQGAQVYIDWNNDGYGSTLNVDYFALNFITNTGNNSKWNNYVTMRAVGTHNRKYLGWQSGQSNYVTANIGTFTVTALSDPTNLTATTASITQLNLTWTKWNSKNVMIVRRLTSGGASTAPTQGSAYTVGTTLGTGTIVYNSSAASFNDTGLTPGTSYTYVFYSENNSYYSPGATTSEITTTQTSSTSDYFRSKVTGNWNTAGTWESSPDNTNWIISTLVPNASATAITILNGHNVTLDTDVTISALTINSGGTFTASDGTPRTLTISKSGAGSSTTLLNNGTWANGTGGSTVVFTGAPSSGDAIHAITGINGFNNITINKTSGSSNVGASFSTGSTLAGTLEIGNGGYVSTAPPNSFYGANAVLKFNQGSSATYNVGSTDNSWSNSVIPNYITITSGTVNLNADRTASGNLLINGGTLVLNSNTPNLTIQGNWTRSSGSFTANTGTVTLSGSMVDTVNVTGGANMYNLIISKTGGATATIASPLTVSNNLTINSGAIMKVNPGIQITTTNGFTNSGTLSLLSDNTGTATILTPSAACGNGTVQQYLSSGRNWYMASPVGGATVPTGQTYYSYDETGSNTSFTSPASAYWVAVMQGTSLSSMKGYIVQPGSASTITFTGTLNYGNQTASLTRTTGKTKEGFNLVGNPYPSYLDWALVDTTAANIMTSVWYRTQTSGNTYTFDTYNGKLNVATTNGANLVTNLIPPMQAFWVRVKLGQTAGTLTFTNAMRKHVDNTSNKFKAPAQKNSSQQLLRLQVSNGVNADETILCFNPNALNGFDSYDSQKMSNNNPVIPEIYTTVGAEQLVINGMNSIPLDTEIPLGFNTGEQNNFTISATEISNFDPTIKVILKDYENTLNPETDITTTGYNFSSNSVNTTNRFSIIFRSSSISTKTITPATDNIKIFLNASGQITINYGESIGENSFITISNVVGQKLLTKSLTSATTKINNSFTTGVYLISVSNSGKTTTSKIIIN